MNTENTSAHCFLHNRFGESYLPDINRNDFEKMPSSNVFERRLTIDFSDDDCLYLIVGTDSGLLKEYLRDIPLGKGSRRLFVESDELHALIAPRGSPDSDEAALCRFSDWESVLETYDTSSYAHGGRIELIESLGCQHDLTGVYTPILDRIKTHLVSLIHQHKIVVSGQFFVRMQMHNACENIVPASIVGDIGVGHTAVVLGGGPSLDTALEWITAHRESLFLISASRLCGKLQSLGLRPDLVVAVDPESGMYDLSKEGIFWDDVPLAHSYHLAPQLLHQWRGPRLYLGDVHPWKTKREEDGGNIASHGPTVSHCAAWLAHCWRFDRILMCGVDMCFAVGGGSHTKGSVESMLGALPSECVASVRTYAGRLAGTARELSHGVECLESMGQRINADGPRLFNTNPDAARVDSIPQIDLDTIDLDGPRPRLALPTDQSTALPTALPSPAPHLEKVRREHIDAARRFGKIARHCNAAIRLLDAMETSIDDEGFHKPRLRLERLEKGIGKEHGSYYDLIKRYGSSALLATIKPSGFDEENSQSQEWGRRYYRTVRDVAKTLEAILKSCDERTAMRLMELDDAPDIDALLAFWAEDQTPGRVLALRERLLADPPDVSAETRARVESAAQAFLGSLESKESDFATQTRDKRMKPDSLMRNLNFLFKQEIAADLGVLAEGLLTVKPPYDLFAHHAAGLHAELEDELETALDSYQRVVDRFGQWLGDDATPPDGFERLLEEALQRIAHCYLKANDGESAVGALALLVQLSPYYIPQYARLQHLLGRHSEALEALELYLQGASEDWRILLQMAEIYSAIGSEEAATMARGLADEKRAEAHPVDLAA